MVHDRLTKLPLVWTWEPSVLAGVILLAAAYALLTGPLRQLYRWGPEVPRIKQVSFYAGIVCVFIALVSPLDFLADRSLFSAHMVQHLLLSFIAPPLWLYGLPDWLQEKLLPQGPLRIIARKIISPLPAFVIFNTGMWVWHIPAAYQAALENEGLHIVEHLTFMSTAVIGWAPVLVVGRLNPLPSPGRGLYLLASSFSCTGLAALLTFSDRVLYPFYIAAAPVTNMTVLEDQQLGGLYMWLTADTIFVAAILVVIGLWLMREPAG